MRRKGLTAAGLAAIVLLAMPVVVAAATNGGPRERHTCTPTDRHFIRQASINLTAVGSAGRDYLAGAAEAEDVVADTRRAARIVERTDPTDPALRRTRLLLGPMFDAYGRAVVARERNRDAGPFMYRAYGLANFAHDILSSAQPELQKRGCDVSSLL